MTSSGPRWQVPNLESRHAVARAEQIARAAGHGELGLEHLLVGLRSDPSWRSAIILKSLGWPALPHAAVVDAIPGDHEQLPFGPEVRRVADAAYGVARRCGQNYVGTEHLLLALAEQPGATLEDPFAQYGTTVERLNDAAERVCDWGDGPRYSPSAQDAIRAAEDEASAAGRETVLVADLLVALAACSGDSVAGLLADCGLSADALRSGLAKLVPRRSKPVARVRYGDILISSLYVADQCARERGLDRVGPRQLLLGILAVRQNWVEDLLNQSGTSPGAVRSGLPDIESGSICARTPYWEAFSESNHEVLLQAAATARAAGAADVGVSDVVSAALAVVPDALAGELASLGLRVRQTVDSPADQSSGGESCPPLSDELAAGLRNAVGAWVSQGRRRRVSSTHLLLGLLGHNGADVQAWLKERRVTPWDALSTVTRYALRESWTDEARRVWRKATTAARQAGAADVGMAHFLLALAAEPTFKEQSVLAAHGMSSGRIEELLADRASAPPAQDRDDTGLPLDEECQQLCKAAIDVATEASQLRVRRSDLVSALATKEFATLTRLGVDHGAFGEHLRAPESLWEAHEELAASTRNVAELRAIHGSNHIATASANDRRLAAMLELGLRPGGGPSDPKMLWRLNRGLWSHSFHGWLAVLRHRDRRLWRPMWWPTLAGRRELGDVLRGFFLWKKLQYDGAYDRDSSGRGGLAEFDTLLVRYDTAIADAQAGGTDWQLGDALLNRADVLDAIGRFPEARADRKRFGSVISEDDDASSLLWMRGQTSLPQIHDDLESGPHEISRADRWEARWILLGLRAKTFLDFWFPWASTGDWRLRDSLHSVGALLPRTEMAVIFLRAGAVRTAIRELRRITRARRRFHRSRHPQTLSAEVMLAHAQLVAATRTGISPLRRAWRVRRAWRSIGQTRELHVTWLGPGHPLTLRTQTLAVDALLARGRAAEALDTAVQAIAAADAARYRFDDTRTREGWRNVYAGLMRRALERARASGENHLVVELVEAARGQGVPIVITHRDTQLAAAEPRYVSPGSTSFDRSALSVSAGLALIADVPVAPMGHVSVSGDGSRLDSVNVGDVDRSQRSREGEALASLIDDIVGTESTVSGPAAVDLISLARDVTGHRDPWIWGSWDVDDAVVSYLIRPNAAGEPVLVDIFNQPRCVGDERTPLGTALQAFGEAMMTDDEQSRGDAGVVAFVARSDLTKRLASERRLLTELGLALIPEPLREEAARRADRNDDPIPLVVMPAPSCASLPLSALGVAAPATAELRSDDATRLIEGARIFLVPGPQFAAAAQARHAARWRTPRPSMLKPLAVVAEQPGSAHQLQHAHASVPEAATTLRCGASATLGDTIDTLSTNDPGRPGLLQFSGHARAGEVGLPADAHLVLHNGFDDARQRLYARDLVRGRFPNLGIPRTVVLSACSAWGDDGAADWLGLAPGFIWCGAKNVIATLWPILDLEEAATADRLLVEILAADTRSPVDVVRDFQLVQLARQREASHDIEWSDTEPEDLGEKANSYLWAPFAVITVAGPRDADPASDLEDRVEAGGPTAAPDVMRARKAEER